MRRLRLVFACAFALAAAACAHKGGGAAPQASLPPMLIDDRGVVMPLEQAVTKISYKPWIPPRQILKYAVIPPLGDLDTPDHRGIAIEYQYKNQAMLLSEWPKQNFTLLFLHGEDITGTPCKIAHYKADGAAWTTKSKLAMTLQPDGNVSPKDVDAEAKRLIAAGACN
ncbi:MAG TPA: hypothetical protein VMB20_02645 [Candidatus Acidoferrum sp.]|nr:hypothetical protein [Candidatus Acidoferrum sp.]